ncbi:MAG: toll/interleukin-1 receptor domain-containing protein [Acidobacteria bacterium]|nr:toll/interleukin-1 receptor domain-containing protein [Acidobacteriota bacterium]
MTPKEIFLSHSSEDHEFATSVANTIRQYGIPVWYAPTNMVGAQEWQDEIGLALRRCDWFAVILSPNSVESMWVKRELQYALHQRRFEKRIVPVLYLPCDPEILSWTLPSLHTVDFTQSLDNGWAALLRIWGIGYQKAS